MLTGAGLLQSAYPPESSSPKPYQERLTLFFVVAEFLQLSYDFDVDISVVRAELVSRVLLVVYNRSECVVYITRYSIGGGYDGNLAQVAYLVVNLVVLCR